MSKKKKTIIWILLLLFIAFAIFIGVNWDDFKQGFMNGYK